MVQRAKQKRQSEAGLYERFAELNGRHPLRDQVPESTVSYPVRRLPGGRVLYFNFALAREMGLLSQEHPDHLNPDLERTILDTFCLRIINEFDQAHRPAQTARAQKANTYMATRYLQLQHADKAGRTSGDGRGIWNGYLKGPTGTWDVSSRGTGVTCLAPGAVEAGRPLESGTTDFGYGCGLADLDELLGAAVLSEIFFHNGVNTERVLAIIDLDGRNGIGVRAGQNLLRPAHLFLHLKQGNHSALQKMTDYFIERQKMNGKWPVSPRPSQVYKVFAEQFAETLGRFVAQLEREYVFVWLDWDGDNLLLDPGIIDYGSVRLFGLRHDAYRYDDIDRLSTTLSEQKNKAHDIVQTMAQLAHFLKTGERRARHHFANSAPNRIYRRAYQQECLHYFLQQCGYPAAVASQVVRKHRRVCEAFYRSALTLERRKRPGRSRRVADGLNRPSTFNLRELLRRPELIVDDTPLDELWRMGVAKKAPPRSRRLTPYWRRRLLNFRRFYREVARLATSPKMPMKVTAPSRPRITGDSLIFIVDELLAHYRKATSAEALYQVMERLVAEQTFSPQARPAKRKSAHLSLVPTQPTPDSTDALWLRICRLLEQHQESI